MVEKKTPENPTRAAGQAVFPAGGPLICHTAAVSDALGGAEASGPLCPGCGAALREHLRSEQIRPAGASADIGTVSVVYCGKCGWTLAASARPSRALASLVPPEVADPDDPTTPEGEFQLRCRELTIESIGAGFVPGGWIAMINERGATATARDLLREGRILPVTRWLVQHGRPELTMEHEVCDPRWVELFSPEERAEATRRLGSLEARREDS
jgi:hypothetical protein